MGRRHKAGDDDRFVISAPPRANFICNYHAVLAVLLALCTFPGHPCAKAGMKRYLLIADPISDFAGKTKLVSTSIGPRFRVKKDDAFRQSRSANRNFRSAVAEPSKAPPLSPWRPESVSTQAEAMLRIVLHWRPDLLAAIVPATPLDKT